MQIAVLGLGALDVFDGSLSVGALIAFNMVSGRGDGAAGANRGAGERVPGDGAGGADAGERHVACAGAAGGVPGGAPVITGALGVRGGGVPVYAGGPAGVGRGEFFRVAGAGGGGGGAVGLGQDDGDAADPGDPGGAGGGGPAGRGGHTATSTSCTCGGASGWCCRRTSCSAARLRDNLAAVRPEASLEEIVQAARMAGADEFIDRLPQGYETPIEENGSNFSGGAAAADRDRPGAADPAPAADLRRGDQRAGPGERGGDPGQPGRDRPGADADHRVAQADVAAGGGCDPGARGMGGCWTSRRTGCCWAVRGISAAVAAADAAFRVMRRAA